MLQHTHCVWTLLPVPCLVGCHALNRAGCAALFREGYSARASSCVCRLRAGSAFGKCASGPGTPSGENRLRAGNVAG